MSDSAGIDLRIPIGALFVVLGVLLAGFGLITNGDSAMYVRSTGVNLNLVWGAVMTVFGAVFLWLGMRGTRSA